MPYACAAPPVLRCTTASASTQMGYVGQQNYRLDAVKWARLFWQIPYFVDKNKSGVEMYDLAGSSCYVSVEIKFTAMMEVFKTTEFLKRPRSKLNRTAMTST